MSKKRIAFFGIKYFPSKGGSSRIAENLAKELQFKYNITIYCYKNPLSQSHLENVKVFEIPKIPLKEVGVFIYYFLCCVHIMFSKKYDIIHVHKTDSAVFIPLLRLRSKVIATSQEAPYLRDKWSTFTKWYFRFMEYVFMHSSAVLTSVSKPLAVIYEKKYGTKVNYIPNGVETKFSSNVQAANNLLKTYNIGPDDEFILFAARRIMSTKGLHTLLEGLHKINYKGTIVIVGQELHAKNYMKRISKLAEGLNIKFLGYVEDKAILMALVDRSKYFIFPSLTEGLSLMLLEVGCRDTVPMICSDIPENTEVFSKEEVLFFKANDSDDFSEKFVWALNHSKEMKEKQKLAEVRVNADYSSKVVAEKYEALYKQMLQNK